MRDLPRIHQTTCMRCGGHGRIVLGFDDIAGRIPKHAASWRLSLIVHMQEVAMPHIELTEGDEAEVEEFAGRLFGACLAAMELANVELGVRLGLYEALAGGAACSQ